MTDSENKELYCIETDIQHLKALLESVLVKVPREAEFFIKGEILPRFYKVEKRV